MAKPDADDGRIVQEFKFVVNMTPTALRSWLKTSASQGVGMTDKGKKVTQPGSDEAVGHKMGQRILSLQAKQFANFSDDDLTAMRKVIGYVHRHLKQHPHGDVTETRWRRSLMNWGHDPLN